RRHTRTEWEGVMEDMIARGSKGTAGDFAILVDYLNENLGKANVNAATAAELQRALKISESDARAIVSWRDNKGTFRSFEEVRRVPAIDQAAIQDKRGWMSCE